MLDFPEMKLCICLDKDGRLGKFHSPIKSTLPCLAACPTTDATNATRTSPRVAIMTGDLQLYHTDTHILKNPNHHSQSNNCMYRNILNFVMADCLAVAYIFKFHLLLFSS